MNPYKIDLPAVVSFSGGRTSGFMLRQILDAHGGQPRDLKVCFQNTGLEHEASYDFVRECAERWCVNITWLEYDLDEDGGHSYRIVNYDSASRNGEPFDKLIQKKQYLPNPVARICTANLKVATLDRFLREDPDFASYTNAVGLRYDEPRRVVRMRNDNSREEVVCPMYDAGHTEQDVLAFWEQQTFDLRLPLVGNMAGNCVGCFLKGRDKLEMLMLEMPEYFEWWERAEQTALASAKSGASFRKDRPSYANMMANVKIQGQLFAGDEDTVPCFCTD